MRDMGSPWSDRSVVIPFSWMALLGIDQPFAVERP
jgi:hypothetical protein